MLIDVALLPRPAPAGATVVVIDVVRAMSALVAALAAGADGVVPVAEVEQARQLASRGGALLCGERGGLPPVGFDLGNSPESFTPAVCRGRAVVMSTTNGTAAVALAKSGSRVLAGGLINAEAVARAAVAGSPREVLLLCAGSGGELAVDDVAAAGCIAGNLLLLAGGQVSDAARVAIATFDAWRADLPGLLARSVSGRKLAAVGLEGDLAFCARVDQIDLAPELDRGGAFR